MPTASLRRRGHKPILMKRFLLALAVALAAVPAFAQNEAIFTQYTITPFLINPAAAGFDQLHQARLHYRSSWTGFPDAPNTYSINYNGPVSDFIGLGGSLLAESIANQFRYNLRLAYAFRTEVNDWRIGAGFSTAFGNTRLRESRIGSYGYDQGDLEALEAFDGKNSFDAALGFHGKWRNQTTVGLTFPSLVSTRLDQIDSDNGEEKGSVKNFIFRVGQDIRLRDQSFKITPSVMVSRVFGAPFRVDFNAIASFLDEQFIAGLGYRAGAGNDAGLMLGTKWERLRLFYSYDFNFGTFQTYSGGAHELTLGFDLDSQNKTVDAARYE